MSFQVKLIIHGVPFGQKMWGEADDQDKQYISTLYNPADNATRELLKVEKIGQKAYYSYIKCGNVADSNGRTGSYFGLTLVMNAYYADLQNIYGILRAVYEKLCVGVYVSDNGKNVRFIVADFAPTERKNREIQQHAINAISVFTSTSDLISLSGLPGSNSRFAQINLQACTSATALQTMRTYGCLKVSPNYPSPETDRLRAENAKKLQEADKRHNDDMQSLKNQHDAQISQLQSQLSQKEQELRGGKKGLQDKIDQLQRRLSDLEKQHKGQYDEISGRLQAAESAKSEIVSQLSSIVSKWGKGAKPQGKEPEQPKHGKNDGKNGSVMSFIKDHFQFPLILLLILVFGFVGWKQNSDLSEKVALQNEWFRIVAQSVLPSATESQQLAEDGNLRIDVKGEGYANGKIKEGFVYVALIGAKGNKVDTLVGNWEVEGLELGSGRHYSDNPATFHFTDDGNIDTVRISYTVDGQEVVSQKYAVEHEKE